MNVHMSARRFGALLAAVGIVGLVLTLVLPSIGVNLFTAKAVPPKSPPAATCGAKATYLAYDAPKGSNNFGAAVTSTDLATVKKELKSDFCADPLLLATDKAFAESGLQLDAKNAETKAQQYAADAKTWSNDVDEFFSTATDFRLVADNHKYYSIGMIPSSSKNVMPSLVRGEDPVNIGMTLTFKYKGVTRELRLVCHFQPVVPRPFPHVPPKPTPPGKKTTPPAPPSSAPPSSTPPTHTHSKCNCVTKPSASQKVPSPAPNPPGASVSTRPSANPTGPSPKTNSPAPTNTPGGYNAGGGRGSAPGGSQCGSSGCQGGGAPSPTGPAPTPTQVSSQPPQSSDPGL